MDDQTLISTIEQEEQQSIGATSGLLAEQRRKAMQYYYGQPYGNEIEGRSQVVTTEVLDAVEGMLPSLMSIFMSTDEVVRFDPKQRDDEEKAAQATDYVNYLFSTVNNGFVGLYCFFKDALLQKNGFLKVYWEESGSIEKETYEGLDQDQFVSLVMDPSVVPLAHTMRVLDDGAVVHDVKIQIDRTEGKLCIDPVPPEEVLVSRRCPNDIKKARFVEHRTKKSLSQLRQEGFDAPDDLPGDDAEYQFSTESVERNQYDDNQQYQAQGTTEGATREVTVRESYVYVDYDGDGIAELRQVTHVGRRILNFKNGGKANVEIDSIPFVTATPILMPHKLYGLSLADLVMSIQEVKSSVTRSLMDNFWFINNGRYEVLDGMVNMGDMLTNRPGGIVRSKVLGAVKRIDTPALGTPAYQMLEYWDRVKEARVGKRTFGAGPDADVLQSSATGAEIYKQWDMERIELIARIFAETGVKDLFWKILELVCKHQKKSQIVRLRDQWVSIDPREWKNKFDMTVTVGLGTGSKQTVLQGATAIMNTQAMFAKMGLFGRVVTEKDAYDAASELVGAVFPKKKGLFFTNPAQLPPPQPQVDPKIMLADKKAMMGDAQKRDKMRMDYDLAMKKMAHDAGMSQADFMAEMAKMNMDNMHDEKMQSMNLMHEHVQGAMDRDHETEMRPNDSGQ